jgi:hypothetical protein
MFFLLLCLISATYGELLVNATRMPFSRTAMSSIQVENRIYFVGGFEMHDEIASNKIEVFDINTKKFIQQLELPAARGFVSPAVIHPNLYFVGGRSTYNCPLLWDATTHNYISVSTPPNCGSTVRTPLQVSMHNSKLTVLGRFSADFYLVDTSTWYYSEKLTSWMQNLAGGVTIVHEDLIVGVSGFNISSKQQYKGAWIFNSTPEELQTFNNVTTVDAAVQSRNFSVASGTIAIWTSDRFFVHHLGTSMWHETLANDIMDVISLPDTTFVVDKNGYWQFSWQNNSVERIPIENVLSAFGVIEQFVLLRTNEALVYDGTWTSITTTITSVKSVTLWFDSFLIWTGPSVLFYKSTNRTILDSSLTLTGIVAVRAFDEQTFLYFQQSGQIIVNTFSSNGNIVSNTIDWQKPPGQLVAVIGRDIVDFEGNRVLINLTTGASLSVSSSYTLSTDLLVAMSDASKSTIYTFIDVYNYETGVWTKSPSLTFYEGTNTAFRPIATLQGNKLIVPAASGSYLYDTSSNNATKISGLVRGTTTTTFTSARVIGDTAFFPLERPTGIIEISNGVSTTVGSRDSSDVIDSFVHQSNAMYFLTAPAASGTLDSIYTYDIEGKLWQKYTLQNGPQTSASIALTNNTLFVFCGDGSIQFVNADKIPDWGSTQYNWTGILPTVVTTLSGGTLLTAGGKHVTLGYYSNEINVFDVSTFIEEAALMSPESSSPAALAGSELVAAIVVPIVVVVVAAVAFTVVLVLRRNKKKRQRGRSVVGLEQRYGKWFIPFSDLKFGEQLGQGSSGQVFRGTWKNTSVALKVSMTQANSSVISELELMMQLRPHPNVVQLFGFSVHPETDSIILVIEFCNDGSLDNALFDITRPEISTSQKITWMLGVAKGLGHLHANHIVHRDVAARNVLLQNNEPKITDFGMSRLVEEDKRGTTKSELGPIRWMAPESLRNKEYSTKSGNYFLARSASKLLLTN